MMEENRVEGALYDTLFWITNDDSHENMTMKARRWSVAMIYIDRMQK